MEALRVQPDVEAALAQGRPIVALESAVITCGLPEPHNIAVAERMVSAVRDEGAVPAMTGVLDGRLRVGLDAGDIARLAEAGRGRKVAARDLGRAIAFGATAGTTVAATLVACRMVPGGPIRVMATGGIGGVHRGWQKRLDISGDLGELAASPVAVVCSGPKAVLDVAATYEALEALGVPVMAVGTSLAPSFYCRPSEPLGPDRRVETAAEAAAVCRTHWDLTLPARGVLVANPVPADQAVDRETVELALAEFETREGDLGAARTPALLEVVNTATAGRAMEANLALLIANATLAGKIAVALAQPAD